jgi:serpin B
MNGTSQFTVANSVWVNKDRQLVPDFQKAMDSYYKAYFDNIDADKPESSADKINDWVSDNTAGLIDNIVTPDNITSDTSAVLVNAIYFNSNWNEDWVVKQDGSFTDFNGNKKNIESITNSVERYYENDKARAFGMGYKNGFTFVGILPKEEGEFNIQDLDIEELLKNDKTDECTEILAEMPKLKYETSNNVIKSAFMDMGMGEIFGPSAHFENLVEIGPDEYTYISDIIQKCTIDLDEYGTEASAATAFMFMTSELAYDAREPVIQEVILDRPFAFIIYESETGEIAFMGKVNNVE